MKSISLPCVTKSRYFEALSKDADNWRDLLVDLDATELNFDEGEEVDSFLGRYNFI